MRLYDVIRNAFILTGTHFGPMIVNRLDYGFNESDNTFSGVGADLLEHNEYRRPEIDECFEIIKDRYKRFGRGVMVLDIGANIGTYTLGWAHRMHKWGCILAIEAQERIFYALAGNVALNNCFNVQAMHAVVKETSGIMTIPEIDLCSGPANFGGLSLTDADKSYDVIGKVRVPSIAIDDLKLQRLDFMKIDVQGMELEVLRGAKETIAKCNPVIVIEANFSSDEFCYTIPGYSCRKFGCIDYLMEPLEDEPVIEQPLSAKESIV